MGIPSGKCAYMASAVDLSIHPTSLRWSDASHHDPYNRQHGHTGEKHIHIQTQEEVKRYV